MVQAVVRDDGGVLTVRSRVGEGSTFRILLPRVAQPSDDEPTAPGAACSRCPRGNETVLLVDDEVGVRELVRDLLKRCGYTVIEAADVNDAIALFARHRDEHPAARDRRRHAPDERPAARGAVPGRAARR